MTKREFYANVIAMVNGSEVAFSADEMIAQANHEIELLNKKSASRGSALTGKAKEKHDENLALKAQILDILSASETPMTIPMLMDATGVATSQKIGAMLIQLRKAGSVKRTYEKRVAHFEIGSELE